MGTHREIYGNLLEHPRNTWRIINDSFFSWWQLMTTSNSLLNPKLNFAESKTMFRISMFMWPWSLGNHDFSREMLGVFPTSNRTSTISIHYFFPIKHSVMFFPSFFRHHLFSKQPGFEDRDLLENMKGGIKIYKNTTPKAAASRRRWAQMRKTGSLHHKCHPQWKCPLFFRRSKAGFRWRVVFFNG